MIYEGDARLLRALILRPHDAPADAVARLAVLRAKYLACLDGGMLDLIARAREAQAKSVARVELASDRAFLNGLIEGTEDLLSEETFPRLEPMFTRYAECSEMSLLLEKAAVVFGDAVQELAAWVQAGIVIDGAAQGARDEWN